MAPGPRMVEQIARSPDEIQQRDHQTSAQRYQTSLGPRPEWRLGSSSNVIDVNKLALAKNRRKKKAKMQKESATEKKKAASTAVPTSLGASSKSLFFFTASHAQCYPASETLILLIVCMSSSTCSKSIGKSLGHTFSFFTTHIGKTTFWSFETTLINLSANVL